MMSIHGSKKPATQYNNTVPRPPATPVHNRRKVALTIGAVGIALLGIVVWLIAPTLAKLVEH